MPDPEQESLESKISDMKPDSYFSDLDFSENANRGRSYEYEISVTQQASSLLRLAPHLKMEFSTTIG
jgi:hypothetical protein